MPALVDDPRLKGFALLDRGPCDIAAMQVERARRHSAAVLMAMIDIVEQSGSYRDDGHRDVVCWAVAVLGTSRAEANELVAGARLIRDHATIGDAVADGHFGLPHLHEIALLHGNDRIRPVLAEMPDLITELIHQASERPINQFRVICKRVERNADPDGTFDDHDRARHERSIRSTRRGTAHRIVIDGDALSGAAFDEVLDRFVQDEFEQDWAEGRRVHGNQMRPVLMARTDRQRRFDAFMAMIRAAADSREHRCSGRGKAGDPLVVIHCDADTVETVIRNHGTTGNTGATHRPAPSSPDDLIRQETTPTGRPGGDGDGDADGVTDTDADVDRARGPDSKVAALLDRRAETSSGAPVSDNDLFIALLLGSVQRVIHDPADGHIVDLGRTRRLFTGAARKAALTEHNTCCHPGCGVTGHGLQLDHNTPWAALMGPTDQRNVRVKCRFHNRNKENLGLRTERHATLRGVYRTYRADGTQIAPRSSPATFRRRRHPPGATA